MPKKCFALFPVLFLMLLFCPNIFAKYPLIQNERLAMNAMRTLYNAEVQYQATAGSGDFGYLVMLRYLNLIDEALASGEKYGYRFTVFASYRTITSPPQFFVYAVPLAYRRTGIRSFYIDHRCTLRGADKRGVEASLDDPAIEPCVPAIIGQNEARVIQALRIIHNAQINYQSTVGNGSFANFNVLRDLRFLNWNLTSGVHAQYLLECTVTAVSRSAPAFYKIQAKPLGYGEVGIRSFYIDASGIVRGADKNGQFADVNDPPVESFSERQTDR